VLLEAAKRERIELEPALDALRDAGFWIGDELYRQAIDAVNNSKNES
jgi:hypothetical protein